MAKKTNYLKTPIVDMSRKFSNFSSFYHALFPNSSCLLSHRTNILSCIRLSAIINHAVHS